MSNRLRAAHLALLLVALSAPAAVAGGLTEDAGPRVDSLDGQVDDDGHQLETATPAGSSTADQTNIRIQLRSSGDAHWIVTTYFNITSEQEQASFNETAQRFEEGETVSLGLSAFRRASNEASTATGRAMNLTAIQRTSNSTEGSLTLSFTWANFARSDGDVLYVDDVYNTPDPWLSGIEANQELVVELPPGSGVRSAPKRVQDGRITWSGPVSFTQSDLELAYSPTRTTTPPTPTSPTTASPTTAGSPSTGTGSSPGTDRNGSPALWGSFLVIGLGIAALSVYMLSMRDGDPFDGGTTATDTDDSDNGQSGGTASGSVPDESAPDDDSVDTELLSDEERVERLLDQNGGRMKQANIVKETGWSNAKVSQLLSAMADDGEIDKLRIGRENLISFPDEDVTDIED